MLTAMTVRAPILYSPNWITVNHLVSYHLRGNSCCYVNGLRQIKILKNNSIPTYKLLARRARREMWAPWAPWPRRWRCPGSRCCVPGAGLATRTGHPRPSAPACCCSIWAWCPPSAGGSTPPPSQSAQSRSPKEKNWRHFFLFLLLHDKSFDTYHPECVLFSLPPEQ